MHRMVASDRHAAENNFRLTRWHNLALFQVIAKDPVINFSIEPMLVEGDACTAVAAFVESLPKADVHIRFASTFGVLQRYQKSARVRLIVAVVTAAPG